jgi:transposase
LTEKLKEHEQIDLSREKVRRILRSWGLSSPRKRRAAKHRSRRERRLAQGMMLRLDGSRHDWLEGRGPGFA